MTPTLVGYFPKRTLGHPDWLKAAVVEEVCSASPCMSRGPDNWDLHWLHNQMGVYDSPELAWGVVPEVERAGFELYAFQVFPVAFAKGERGAFVIPPLQVQPLPASFQRLGYDVVSWNGPYFGFGCSPLSCMHMADHVPTNRHCLFDEVGTAFRMAMEFEPVRGDPKLHYYVVEVWREQHKG
jgi:hypothetical protein